MNALLLGPYEKGSLAKLRDVALANPVDMLHLIQSLKTDSGKATHRAHMTMQTVTLPVSYMVTFSIETNAPCGTQLHMSMSTSREGYVPNPAAVWMVAECLGFVGSLDDCVHYVEELQGHGQAVNVVQPMRGANANH